MVDKRNSPLEARSESEAVRTRHEVQDGKNDSCCLLLLALSSQFAVSVMWIGYVIVYFSGHSTRCRAVELTYVTNCSLWKRMMAWERKLPSKGLWDIFRGTLKVSMPKHVRCCVPLWTNNFLKLLVHRLGDIARLQQLWDNSKRQTIHSSCAQYIYPLNSVWWRGPFFILFIFLI